MSLTKISHHLSKNLHYATKAEHHLVKARTLLQDELEKNPPKRRRRKSAKVVKAK